MGSGDVWYLRYKTYRYKTFLYGKQCRNFGKVYSAGPGKCWSNTPRFWEYFLNLIKIYDGYQGGGGGVRRSLKRRKINMEAF